MDKQNLTKILEINALRDSTFDEDAIPRKAQDIMRTIAERSEEADARFKMLEFLNNLGSTSSKVLTEIDRSYFKRQERHSEDEYIVKVLEELTEYINERPDLKILDVTIAKDFSYDQLSSDFIQAHKKLKRLIDERELEVTFKVISVSCGNTKQDEAAAYTPTQGTRKSRMSPVDGGLRLDSRFTSDNSPTPAKNLRLSHKNKA